MEELFSLYKRDPWIWTFLVGSLVLLSYAAKKIKEEKDLYLKTAIKFKLKNVRLKIPSWWTLIEEKSDQLKFERTDTHYDWYSNFQIIDTKDNLHTIAKSTFKSREIELDPDFDLDENLKEKKPSIRFEGMGTQSDSDRVYYDLFLKQISDNKVLLAESRSSVLNGGIEGPYFEEVIKRVEVKKILQKNKNKLETSPA